MRIYLDNSPHKIAVKSCEYDYDFGQFRTPLTKYAIAEGTQWVLDNGAYSGFDRESFIRMQTVALDDDDCEWIVIPDRVGDHDETLRLFDEWMKEFDIPAHKAAFVAQNGCSQSLVPWEDIGCLFIGGTNEFKDSVVPSISQLKQQTGESGFTLDGSTLRFGCYIGFICVIQSTVLGFQNIATCLNV